MLATATVNTVWDYFPAYIIASLAALAISLMLVFTILLKMRRTKEMNQFREQFQKMDEMSNKNPLLGHALQFKNNSKTLLDFVQKESLSKKTFSFSLPCSPPFFMTADPEINQRLLLTGLKEGIYQKPALGKRHMRELFGHGIFLSDGKEWQRLRGIANPLFHKASIQSYVPLFVENSIKLVEVFKAKAAEAPENGIDLQNYFLRYTLDTFCEIGFGVQLNSISDGEEANRFFEALEYISDHGEKRMKTGELWRVKEFFIKDQKFIESVKYLDEFIFKIIDDRRNESKEDLALKTDLLSQLMSQGSLSEKELRDWVVNLIIAGRDTTALLLTWCIFELCQDKGSNIKNKIFEEICENLDISPSDFNSEKFSPEFILNNVNFEFQKKQRYLHKVFQETLRLYPPVPINGYEALRDDVIKTSDNKKYFIKKGTICVFSPWVTQRHPDNFEDPESFNPDRFDRPVKPFSFLSFNAGPRICLGQEMAYIEAKILFTCLFSQFEFEIRNVDDVKPKQSIILTAENGLYVNIKPRI